MRSGVVPCRGKWQRYGIERYDLDWLRVIAFGLLMLFHTGMLFSTWDWHVKNLETSDAFDLVMRFLHQWRMPLLFFISGSAVWFAMERYSSLGNFFWSATSDCCCRWCSGCWW